MDIIKDIYQRTSPSNFYVAKPGKRNLSIIYGIDDESVSLTLNFQNTYELSFDIYRFIDGEENLSYSLIGRMMEIKVDNFGWFKIMEEPQSYYSGKIERKTVTAESLEIELTGTDLVGFVINTVASQSKEILAEDNTYETEYGVRLYRDRVLFYRDLSIYDEILNVLSKESSDQGLKTLLSSYPDLFINCWRIRITGNNLKTEFNSGILYYEGQGKNTTALRSLYQQCSNWTEDQWNTQIKKKSIIGNYPKLLDYFTININYEYEDETLSPYELVQLDRKRLKSLSLLDLVLEETPGWTVGYVDRGVYEEYNYSLPDSVGRFEVESENVYAFLTQEVSQYFSCIFTFDTYNCKVNAYRVNSIGKNTNILLGYNNIVNDVTSTSNYDLYTKYYVYGTDYDIGYVNFGSRYIEDLSYFLTTKFMPQSLIDKYKEWSNYKESMRSNYIDYTKQYNSKLSERNEIKYRVPDDGMDTMQWSDMGDEQLQDTLADYEALLKGYETFYVDENGDFDPKAMQSVPSDYDHYYLVKDIIIPNIRIELNNRNVTSSEEEVFWDESRRDCNYRIVGTTNTEVSTAYNNLVSRFGISYGHGAIVENNGTCYMDVSTGFFVAYGTLYGIEELKIQIESFEQKSKVIYKAGYSEINIDEATEYGKKQHQLYLNYQETLKELNIILKERENEYNTADEELTVIQKNRKSLVKSVEQTNDSGDNFTPFTTEELNILSKFYHISDYTNENIVVTSLDDTLTTIDVAQQLYDDAVEQLYVESHPQLSYSTNIGNFLSLFDYEKYVVSLELGDFIRIETKKDYFVKLRLISLKFNPRTYSEDPVITFSDMIRYKFKRNDFISLLNDTSFSSKNSSSILSNASNSKDTITVDADLVKQIINNSYFRNAASNGFGTGYGTGGNSDTIIADNILADYIKTNELEAKIAKIEYLEADSAFIKYLNSELISADKIYTTMLNADEAYIENLAGKMSQFMKISASNITGVDAEFAKVIAGQITVNDLKASTLILGSGVSIKNEDGNFVIDSTGLNIYGKNSEGVDYCGIQLGYDASNNPSLILRNSDGALLLTPDGITENAIVDNLIVTRMISDEAVTGDKVDWASVGATRDKNGNVVWTASSVTYNNEELSTTFSRIETQLDGNSKELEEVKNNLTWKMEILASNGMVLDRTNPSTTLYVQLYYGSEDVTSQYQNNFYWTRQSNDADGDESWNLLHENPTYYIQITRSDVSRNAQFTCNFIKDNETLATQSI